MPKVSMGEIDPGVEYRGHERTAARPAANGRSYCYVTCPFCGESVKAHIWSLAGSGKRCPCGAVHGNYGISRKKTSKGAS
jgi:hypothetical protein